ncbi:carboxypeptidase regulatory-like domain-containing protein [Terriglobus sp.]|uniref:carboxypeptidase regulatory-like domain-containing protein n=1 Tax=Terriglobus sp. TaxID=1889013 RepID=UPI003B00B668
MLLLAAGSTARAQFTGGVQGTVQDGSGGSIASATLTLTNVDTKVSQTATSNSSGVYRFSSLAPGSYQVTAVAAGFSSTNSTFTLTANETRDVPVTLAVGSVTTQVQVTSQQPLLDTSDTRNQLTLDTAALEQLPLAARNPLALITLAPGVTGIGAGTSTNFNPENSVDASANGRGQNGNQYIVDGLDVTSSIRPGVVNLTPNADTVQEASVQTNVYTVDFGRASSIQTVITTKSGTSRYHGFLSEYYTYQGLTAKPVYFPKNTSLAPYHSNNMSFGVGGPIIPNHEFFFFAGFEPYRALASNGTSNLTFEDPAFVAFANTARPNSPEVQLLNKYKPSNLISTGVQSTAQQLFGAACGTPAADNIPCGLPVIDNGVFNASAYNNSNQYNVRADKYFKKDRVYGLFYRSTINNGGPAPRPDFATTSKYYVFSVQGSETHTFNSNLLNEAYGGYNRIEGFSPATGNFTVPVVNVTALGTGFGSGFALGDFIQHSYHWRDVLTFVHGSHSIRAGYEGWHGDDIALFAAAYAQPSFQFNSLIDLINDNPYSEGGLTYDPLTGKPKANNYGYAQTTGGGFVEDTWKASRKLTVNYGMRYDNFGNAYPSLAGTGLSNFHLGTGTTFAQQVASGFLTPQSHTFASDLNYVFSPRAGFAFSPGEDGKWLIHGGIGSFHDYFTLGNGENGLSGNPPNFARPTFKNDGSTARPIFGYGTQNSYPLGFPYPAFGGQQLDAKGGIVGQQIGISGVAGNLRSPFTINFNLAVDRQLTNGFVVSIGYVGSHSGSLISGGGNTGATAYGNDVNAYAGDLVQHAKCTTTPATGTTPAGSSCTGVQTRLNTSFGNINYAFNSAVGNYDGLIVAGRGRFTRRGFLTASYTLGHSLDDWQNYPIGYPTNEFYASSPYDVRHRISIGASYELPGSKLGNGLERAILGGWTFAGTGVAQTGTPFTVATGAAFSAQLIDINGPVTASNLRFAPGSGDFNADGNNNDYPSVMSYKQSHNHADYHLGRGIFASCRGGVLPCGNFVQPQLGNLGNETPNQFRNPGYVDVDATLKKVTPLREGINLELRLDTFNVANRVNYGGVDGNLQDGNFGQSSGTANAARNMLVGARLNF